MRTSRPYPFALSLFLALASGCDDAATSSGSGSTGAGLGGNTSGSSTSGGPTSTSTAGSGTGGNGFQGCTGTVCGDGGCCTGTDECVVDQCLPACPSAVRCGADQSICCAAGDVCIDGACAAPGASCIDYADCADDEFCEPTIGKCLPQPSGGAVCEYKPPTAPLTPTLEWSWTTTAIHPTFVQVIHMPVVVDLDLDGTPDVVIVTSDNYNATGPAYLRALDGKTGAEKWSAQAGVYLDANRVQPRVTPAAADIDGDGYPEIVTGKMGGGLIAFEHDGSAKWTSKQADGTTAWNVGLDSATLAIADLEGDGTPEIVVGGAVFDAAGKLRFDHGALGSNGGYGSVSIVANLDGTGPQEVVGGARAYRSDGTLYWNNNQPDGYPAIADLDHDGAPELVVVAAGKVRVQNPTTGAVLAELTMPGSGAAGPPTIADFDADGFPEIASANGNSYDVFEFVPTAPPALTAKWSMPTQDLSSNRTGSSVFDFEGDGAAEVVYNDECYFRVYDGKTGAVLYQTENSSATIHEYPVVVDVDGDNNTEVLIGGNDLHHVATPPTTTCPYPAANARHGLFVYGDMGDNWVRTRRVWNQHAYHITNIGSDATIPSPEPASWVVPPGFNNYRQSSQGAGVFNAPDLRVSLSASLASCPSAIGLKARVTNQGNLGVPPGIVVRFFQGSSDQGTLIGSSATTKALLPGQSEDISLPFASPGTDVTYDFFVTVDGDAGAPSAIHECLEDNNSGALVGVSCPKLM
ncbi:MAG: FG-GAP-like repeat-containing protein [Polyangiaceae bacterium]